MEDISISVQLGQMKKTSLLHQLITITQLYIHTVPVHVLSMAVFSKCPFPLTEFCTSNTDEQRRTIGVR